MRKVNSISIPKPCQQPWQEMTLNDNGRHCNTCAKTVIDFSLMTTNDIIAHLSLNKNVCGRFENGHLETLNAQLAKPTQFVLSGWKKWSLALGLLTSFGNFKTSAQIKPAIVQTSNKASGRQINNPIPDSDLVTLTGKIVDEQNYAIIGVNVSTLDGKHRAMTDKEGLFKIQVPENTDYLMLRSIGFLQKVLLVDMHKSIQQTVLLKEDSWMGEVMINPPKLNLYEKYLRWLRGDRIY